MSLALVQDYSSDEEPDKTQTQWSDSENDESEKNNRPTKLSYLSHAHAAAAASSQEGSSSLPSALHAFNEVTGPPSFLNNSVFEPIPARPAQKKKPPLDWQSEKNDQCKEKRTVAVVEAKAQLVGVHDRVRSDLTGSLPKDSAALLPTPKNLSLGSGKTVGVALPPPEDAAELLRMCQQCGVPKTYSNAKGGMVCPICRDHQVGISEKEKKKGSTIKEKEKSKRMKGQSSHASWKSETEMQLRQQYD